jgi:hypothetical protein
VSIGVSEERHLPLTSLSLVRICIGCGSESEFIRIANGYPIGQCGPCAIQWLEMYWDATGNGLAGNAEAMVAQLRLFG